MKIKLDFITNSSSASIYLVIQIESDHPDIEDFRKVFNEYMEQYKEGRWGTPEPIHFWDGNNITKKKKDTFEVEEHTSMFNYATEDIPHYMQTLYLQWTVDPGELEALFGFKNMTLRVADDN